jgi:Ni,Fe-hydrogenase III small subunit
MSVLCKMFVDQFCPLLLASKQTYFSKYAFRVYLYNLFVIRIFVIERFCDNLYYTFAISKQNNKIIKKQYKNSPCFKVILVSNAQKTHSSLGKKQMEKI